MCTTEISWNKLLSVHSHCVYSWHTLCLFLPIPVILQLSKQRSCRISLLVPASLLAAFAKLRKATTSFVMSVRPSVRPHVTILFSLNGFSWKFIFEYFFWKYFNKFQFGLKYDKNNGYFLWRLTYFYDNTSLNFSENGKYFRQKLYRKSGHTFRIE